MTPWLRHQNAYYLWEATLKLLGSVALIEYAALKDRDADLAARLKNLARPSLGHWWEFVRRLVPILADVGDKRFGTVRDLLLGKTRSDLPRAAGLDAILRNTLGLHGGPRTVVRLTELFDHLVRYRNMEFGHGAAGQRPSDFYDRLGRSLIAAMREILERLDPLAGRRLVYVGEVRRDPVGRWQIDGLNLESESARRMQATFPENHAIDLPRPKQVYLVGEGNQLVSLHPLVVFEFDLDEVLFLNGRPGEAHCEFLSYLFSPRTFVRYPVLNMHRCTQKTS